MKPHEVLQKIINNNGDCQWISHDVVDNSICNICPLSVTKNSTHTSCMDYVEGIMGNYMDIDYMEVAIKELVAIESERILLGSDSDT